MVIKDQADAIVDVSSQTTMQIKIRKPDDELMTKTASFTTDGTDGSIYYTFISGDVDEKGTYFYEGYVVIPTGTWTTDQLEFKVLPVT